MPRLLGLAAALSVAGARDVRLPLEYPRHALLDSLLAPEQCARIRERAVEELGFAQAKVGSGSAESAEVSLSKNSRRARYAPVPREKFFWAQVYAKAWRLVNETNERLWRFPISPDTMETMQYSIYSAEDRGTYDWHEDVGFMGATASRSLSASIQLSDDGGYEGGDLVLRVGRQEVVAPRAAGTMVLFPSHVTHRVAPVVSGERHSLVLWLQLDAAGAPLRRGEMDAALPHCPPLDVEFPGGKKRALDWRPGLPEDAADGVRAFDWQLSQADAARDFCRKNGVPEKHVPTVVRQIAGTLKRHCEVL